MSATEKQIIIMEKSNDKKWPYVLCGFVIGVVTSMLLQTAEKVEESI